MIASADGASDVGGLSGGLGSRVDHEIFAALRDAADAVLVGIATVVSEHYHAPTEPGLQLLVVAKTPDVSGAPDLFASGRATLVLPADAAPAPEGVPTLRAGTGGRVDLREVSARLAGKVVMMEGGPRLAGVMVALGLVDEAFFTIAPRLVVGDSARIVHGPEADAAPWDLRHGFVDEEGNLFLRYARPQGGAGA